jgi:hypothetical protein
LPKFSPIIIPNLKDIKKVSVGNILLINIGNHGFGIEISFSLALHRNGSVFCMVLFKIN